MSTILKENLSINNKGEALIQYKILKEFIDSTLKRIPYIFNDAENQIQIQIGINEKDIEAYIEKNPFQRRKFLSFEIIEKKIKKSKSSEEIEKIIKNKLAIMDDFSKVSEIIENIKQMYETEKTFRFNFAKSLYLKRFLNKSFDIILSDKKKYLVFDFKSIQDVNPRVLNTTIHQGTLLIHKIGPPKVVKYYNNKNYAIFKIFSMIQHSSDSKVIYDILITPNENLINQIYQDKQYDNPNVFFGKYGKSQNFYISKLKFNEFLKSFGSKFLFVQHKTTGKIFEIPFDEEKYHRFLLDLKYYNDYDTLLKAQEKANRGIDRYYSYYEAFLRKTKQKKINYTNQLLESLDIKDLLVLIGIKKAIGDNEKTTIEEAFNHYIKTCEEKNQKGFTKNTFNSHINTLKKFISIRKRKDEKKIYQFLYLKSYSLKELLIVYKEKENLNHVLENLEDLDFSTRSKRELFDIDVTVYFMNNMDILISRDNSLKLDYSKNLLVEDLSYLYKEATESFNEEYQNLISQKEIYKLTPDYNKNLLFLLRELKYKSLLELNKDFFTDCIYYFSILKKNINFIKNRFEISNYDLLETISIVLGARNAFRKHFPKESSISHFDSFFNLKFSNFTEVNSQFLYKIQKSCQDLIFMFETAQDLKLIREKFKDKFQSNNFGFADVMKKLKALIEPKLNFQNDFALILLELKNGLKKKEESLSGKNIDEITKLLTDQLKDSYTNQNEFENTTQTIEQILKAKLAPTSDNTDIFKKINSYFKEKITSEKNITEVLDYIEGNLKNDFEDKKKFNSILKKIRQTYEMKIEHDKKYTRIVKHIDKSLHALMSQADMERIKTYIQKNFNDVFTSSSQQQNILRQIDQFFKDKKGSSNELEDITKLCFAVIRLLLSDTVWHNILTASVFGLFILAIDKDKDIPLSSICNLLNIQHTSMNLHIKKIIGSSKDKKGKQRFKDLRVKNEETREKVRERLVELLLSSQLQLIFKTHEDNTKQTNLKNLTNEFNFQISFFKRYKQFNKAVQYVSDVLINRFIIGYSQSRDFIQDNLTYRIEFFKNYFNESLQNKMPEIINYSRK